MLSCRINLSNIRISRCVVHVNECHGINRTSTALRSIRACHAYPFRFSKQSGQGHPLRELLSFTRASQGNKSHGVVAIRTRNLKKILSDGCIALSLVFLGTKLAEVDGAGGGNWRS